MHHCIELTFQRDHHTPAGIASVGKPQLVVKVFIIPTTAFAIHRCNAEGGSFLQTDGGRCGESGLGCIGRGIGGLMPTFSLGGFGYVRGGRYILALGGGGVLHLSDLGGHGGLLGVWEGGRATAAARHGGRVGKFREESHGSACCMSFGNCRIQTADDRSIHTPHRCRLRWQQVGMMADF